MSINPMTQITSFDQLSQVGGVNSPSNPGVGSINEDKYSFANALTNAIDDVKTTQDAVMEEAYKLATGQTDNLHDITIASTEANLAVQLFVQIRNKAVSAYQELMNMNI
ncbi:MAG: flagellar hook-basal body complex protein FliE [Oscillospiraceae bacterium]|nr:flagellar hook-basal body complex protein FliE [Oscillospiraceae bacterium]